MPELIKVADLSKSQRSVVESVPRGTKIMSGPAGTGKTSAGVRRMLRLLTKDKVFANEILVLVPQRALALPYQEAADSPSLDAGGRITVGTLGSLSRDVVSLFFPLVAEEMGFRNPRRDPTFLTLESAQYHMARVVGKIITDRAYFDSVAIAQNRLYSQIIDNLNKAALVGFPYTEIAERLSEAWGEKDISQLTIYAQAQECASAFRAYCLDHSLIDFSLQIEIFRLLWGKLPVRSYLTTKYRHLIIDNIEEDTPATHNILLDWIPEAESALIIQDTDAGYRRFLGAAPTSADRLAALVTTNRDTFEFTEADSFLTTPDLRAFGAQLAVSLNQPTSVPPDENDPMNIIGFDQPRFYTEMIRNVVGHIADLVHEQNVPPSEIVVLAPFLSDSLRYTLMEQLSANGIEARSHRPSRALREEPAVKAMLTWAQLAHPNWQMPPTRSEFINALVESVDGLDLARAQLIAANLYRSGVFNAFDDLTSGVQERITFAFGERLQTLYQWLQHYQTEPIDQIDLFWTRLFGEVLSTSGFGFHENPDGSQNAANLIDSAQKFRRMMDSLNLDEVPDTAQEYVEMVAGGVIADQYLRSWHTEENPDSVLLAPAYTFLMSNLPVDYQFWLNVGGSGWWERLYQPLTHPYVLAWGWPRHQKWTDDHETASRKATMYRIALGLVRRCRIGVYLGFSELGEQGYEQRGPLLEAIQRMYRRLSPDIAD